MLILIFICSCEANSSLQAIVISAEGDGDVILRPDRPLDDGRQLLFKYVSQEGEDYLYRGFPFANKVQKVSLEDGSVVEIPIPKEGPYAIRRLNGIEIGEDGLLYLFGDGDVICVQENGDVVRHSQFLPEEMKEAGLENYYIRVNHEFPVCKWGEKLIVHVEKADSDKQSYPYHYQGFLFAIIDQNDFSVKPIDIAWPTSSGYFGSLHKIFFSVCGDDLIYGLGYSPDIYTFDLNAEVVQKSKVNDFFEYQNSIYVGSNDPRELVEHLYKSVLYGALTKDQKSDYSYQLLFTHPPSSDERFGRGHLLGLRVFDSQFGLVAESVLPKEILLERFIRDDDFYIRSAAAEEEGVYRFNKIGIE
jgi:hypothetical protein